MGPSFAIERSLAAFSAVRAGDWDALRAALRNAGIPADLAEEVSVFAPIAFGRVLLEGMGIEFSPEYATPDGAGESRIAGRLLDHPVYGAALAHAIGMRAMPERGDAFVGVALWSAELSAVNEALNAGSDPADLVAGPPLVTLNAGTATPPEAKRPWWRVWG